MAKYLLLVRHAKAEDTHPSGDASRALTESGREAFKKHVKSLTHLCRLKSIHSSSLVRAVQTAELLAEGFHVGRVEISPELRPTASIHKLMELALAAGPGSALVGHNPSLPRLAAKLLGLPELRFSFKKGGALALEKHGDGYQFAWFHAPGRDVVYDLKDVAKK